jgi:hypothetical protein
MRGKQIGDIGDDFNTEHKHRPRKAGIRDQWAESLKRTRRNM